MVDTAVLAAVMAAIVGTFGLFYMMLQADSSGRLEDYTKRLTELVEEQAKTLKAQAELMKRQIEIIEKQDEILARRAELSILAVVYPPDTYGVRRVELRVKNSGKRTATWYYWHLYVPIKIAGYDIKFGEEKKIEEVVVERADGGTWRRYDDHVQYPMAPTRSGVVAVMKVSGQQSTFSVEWQVIADDGIFPGGDEYGVTEIKLDVKS